MLIFGCCVGKSGKFERIAKPSLARVMTPEDVFVREDGRDGICAAYNRVLEIARTTPECEGVILLHDDTEMLPGAREALLEGLRKPKVGVVGVIGGRGLYDTTWDDARRRQGVASDTRSKNDFDSGVFIHRETRGRLDVVDGLLLALAPRAFHRTSFDEKGFPHFHGYDVDYCLSVRDRGMRVITAAAPYHHHDKATYGDRKAFDEAAIHLREKWPQFIRPLNNREYFFLEVRRAIRLRQWGRVRHLAALAVKGQVRAQPGNAERMHGGAA